MDLCVGVLKGDVAETLGPGERAGSLDRGRGDVDAERTPFPCRARGVTGRLPGPASDVEDVVCELDVYGPAQHLVVPAQFGVVPAGAGRLLSLLLAELRPPGFVIQGRGKCREW